MKIAIVGQVGSGKSTLAEGISKKLGIPHIHIDRFWLESGGAKEVRNSPKWQEARLSVKDKFEEAIKDHDSWVSDGWQNIATPSADQVVFLDIPLRRRLYGLARRIFGKRRHPEISRGSDLLFLFAAVQRFYRTDAKMRAGLDAQKSRVLVLRSFKEADRYLQNL